MRAVHLALQNIIADIMLINKDVPNRTPRVVSKTLFRPPSLGVSVVIGDDELCPVLLDVDGFEEVVVDSVVSS